MKTILLVEDEAHKREVISQCVLNIFGYRPEIVDGVSGAVEMVIARDYDLIILDMALPTFGDSATDNKKGHDQAQGGIEVLRALKSKSKSTKVMIVTQYHDFMFGSKKIKLKDAPKFINKQYAQTVIAAVLYSYNSQSTIQKIESTLRTALK